MRRRTSIRSSSLEVSRGRTSVRRAHGTTGKLRIGDDRNAITIIRGKDRGEPC